MKTASGKNIQTYKCLFKSKDFLIFDYSVSSTNLEIFLLSEWAQSCIWNEESGFNKSFPLFYPKSFLCRKQKKCTGRWEKKLKIPSLTYKLSVVSPGLIPVLTAQKNVCIEDLVCGSQVNRSLFPDVKRVSKFPWSVFIKWYLQLAPFVACWLFCTTIVRHLVNYVGLRHKTKSSVQFGEGG